MRTCNNGHMRNIHSITPDRGYFHLKWLAVSSALTWKAVAMAAISKGMVKGIFMICLHWSQVLPVSMEL